jgi:excisionase family DNA binding protein
MFEKADLPRTNRNQAQQGGHPGSGKRCGRGGTSVRKADTPHAPSRYVSIKSVADRASVSTDTIRRMIADGQLRAYRFRGQIRIAIEDIDHAMHPVR